jgi:type I restriction enzyme S subunit
MPFMQATASDSEIDRFRLEVGDVLITKDSETWTDIGVPALVEESADDLISRYHLALLRPRADRITGSFLFRALQSRLVAYQFHVEANGVTRYGLSHAAIKAITIPLPPLTEQQAITAFLDRLDRRIRRYVAGQQRLVGANPGPRTGLIGEYWTRLLADAVTGKIDLRDAPLDDRDDANGWDEPDLAMLAGVEPTGDVLPDDEDLA